MAVPSADAASTSARRDRDWRPPVDLAHLARVTLGDRDLDREVLLLFLRQSERAILRLQAPDCDLAAEAHRLRGSAAAVGAFAVAHAAAAVETTPGRGKPALKAIDALARAVTEAGAFIRSVTGLA
jgi:HPt (histidine-containing phosphotransfer) domain-containing protein